MVARWRLAPLTTPARKTSTGYGREMEARTSHTPCLKDPQWAWLRDGGSHRSLERPTLGIVVRRRLAPLTTPTRKTLTRHGCETEAHSPHSKDPHWAWSRDRGSDPSHPLLERTALNSNSNLKLMIVATCSYVYTSSLKSYMEQEDLTLRDGVDAYEGK